MSQFLSLNKKLLFWLVIGAVFNDSHQVNANEILVYKDYQYSCGKSIVKNYATSNDCENIFTLSQGKLDQQQLKTILQAKTNILKYQKTVSHDTGIADYLVSTILGIYFPTLETSRPHSGGNFFGGIKLQENIRLDAEIVGIFKGNSVEKSYFDLSTFLSLRFSFPLSAKAGYPLLYFSPGIGISELDDRYTNQDDEDTHPTWQLETGVALPIHHNVGGYGGIKYVNQLGEEGDSFLGAECGITFRL